MTIKRVISPARLRKVPTQFSWVDQRLVQHRHIERCDAHAAALYLFLVTVADAQGLSYYSDAAVAQRLSMETQRLDQARRDLIRANLIAYDRPFYQVLDLAPPSEHVVDSSVGSVAARLARLHEALRKSSS